MKAWEPGFSNACVVAAQRPNVIREVHRDSPGIYTPYAWTVLNYPPWHGASDGQWIEVPWEPR